MERTSLRLSSLKFEIQQGILPKPGLKQRFAGSEVSICVNESNVDDSYSMAPARTDLHLRKARSLSGNVPLTSLGERATVRSGSYHTFANSVIRRLNQRPWFR